MKYSRIGTVVFFFAVMWGMTMCTFPDRKDNAFISIEKAFKQIPEEAKLGVYWYWISDNISEEAVVKDLKAMKEKGINRAFIGNIGQDGVQYGDVKMLSEEWWKVMRTALRTATELDIEIGIFNSPGWSQSGGPWVKPEQAMRYLAASQTTVSGGKLIELDLPEIPGDAQDVKVLAFPTLPTYSPFKWEKKNEKTIDFVSSKEAIVRSLTLEIKPQPFRTRATFYVKTKKGYKKLCDWDLDRSNSALNVGFVPYAPLVFSLPSVEGDCFRLIFADNYADCIQEASLSEVPRVERYPEKTLAKMFQTPLPMWHDYLWNEQPTVADSALLIAPEQVVDITDALQADGKLHWEAPQGEWTVMRLAMLPTGVTNAPASPEATGPEIDKLSKEHVAAHFDAFIGEVLRRIPEEERRTFRVVVQDSYETGGQNWTDLMQEAFTERYGYDPTPYLPVMQGYVVGSPELSDRFLWDLRRLIADKVSYDYVGGLKEICNKHGLTTWLENYGHWGFPGEFLQYGGQSDEISGEFWSEGSLGDIENRAASSCGHIYGKSKIWAESSTCGGPEFLRYPYYMKQRGDRFFTEGINSTLLHLYVLQADKQDRKPGINAPYGNEFNRNNTWFSSMELYSDYLKRCNYMLQQGRYVADVAYFIGEDTPKMTGVCDPALPSGYSFDYVNAEVLMDGALVIENRLVLKSGMQYRVLVLPRLKTMRPELLEKIKEMTEQGLTVLGPEPTKSPSLEGYPEADNRVRYLARKLWNKVDGDTLRSAKAGKGSVYSNVSLETIFADMNLLPDFSCKEEGKPFLFIHRTLSDGDIYFVSNQSDKPQSATLQFRVSGKKPERWDPLTAEIRLLPEFKQEHGCTVLPMTLQGYESAFIVFRTGGVPTETEKKNDPEKQLLASLNDNWTVEFEQGRGAPEGEILFEQLTDWSKHKEKGIRYFSGKARYRRNVSLNPKPHKKAIYLDLGALTAMAKVWVNGEYAGGAWSYPYRVNITDLLKKGENTIEVEVVNTWVNRLIGDAALPENERFTWLTYRTWNATSPLQSSGLFGPVEIQAFDYEMIE